MITRHGAKQRRAHPIAIRRKPIGQRTLRQQRHATVHGSLGEREYFVALRRIHDGAAVEIHLWRADTQFAERLGNTADKIIVNFLLNQQPAAGGAGLTRMLHNRLDDEGQRLIEFGVGKNNLRRFPAQFQSAGDMIARRRLLHQLTHFWRARET